MRYLKGFLFIFSLIIVLFIHFLLPRLILETNNSFVSQFMIVNDDTFDVAGNNGKYLRFESFDKIQLEAFLTYSKLDTTIGTIILLHGIRARKEQFKNLSNEISEKGLDVIAVDLRAHGNSGGKFCTFGALEKIDIKDFITHLLETENIHSNIGIWAQSLGGSIAIQCMATDKRIKYGIIESTYSEFSLVFKDYTKSYFGFEHDFFIDYLIKRMANIGEFNPQSINPIDYCKNIDQPIILVHGTEDERINISHGKTNFKAINSSEKEFMPIKNANHTNLWRTGGDEYFKKVNEFITKNTVGNNGSHEKH